MPCLMPRSLELESKGIALRYDGRNLEYVLTLYLANGDAVIQRLNHGDADALARLVAFSRVKVPKALINVEGSA